MLEHYLNDQSKVPGIRVVIVNKELEKILIQCIAGDNLFCTFGGETKEVRPFVQDVISKTFM